MDAQITNRSYSTPKDFFLHLLSIFTLYACVVSFITLLFQYINYVFPDVLNYSYQFTSILDTIRWTTAMLVIMFPVFILISWLIERDISLQPEKAEYRVRKWLLYLTLFLSAVTIIGDLVTLVYQFLNGDLTTSFVLKVLVVLAVAAIVFGYYLWDVRRTNFHPSMPTIAFSTVVCLIVIGFVIAGFFIIGSPSYQRQVRFDERRTNDLSSIQSQIINYWQNKAKLPEKLSDTADSINGSVLPVDPETGKSYEYSIISPLSFNLCATFGTASRKELMQQTPPVMMPDPYSQSLLHTVGHVCFTRSIDPDIYKPYPKTPEAVPVKTN